MTAALRSALPSWVQGIYIPTTPLGVKILECWSWWVFRKSKVSLLHPNAWDTRNARYIKYAYAYHDVARVQKHLLMLEHELDPYIDTQRLQLLLHPSDRWYEEYTLLFHNGRAIYNSEYIMYQATLALSHMPSSARVCTHSVPRSRRKAKPTLT